VSGKDGTIQPAKGFWGAIRTIVVADLVMGLDNVLAVAGAAHGSYLLVVLGLAISVPIVVWGSTIMLHWVERHPGIVYFGAGVLAWTAAKMITSEPFLKDAFAANGTTAALVYLALIGGVLWAGFVKNHRRLESRISARLAVLARQIEAEKALLPARKLLERFGVPFLAHVRVGNKASAIADEARRLRCDRIVMSTARKNSLTRMLEDSTTNMALEQTTVPVEAISGDSVSKLERYGLPAGVATALALLIADVAD
jgi:nucleotide-binding universal stress UspA family protein